MSEMGMKREGKRGEETMRRGKHEELMEKVSHVKNEREKS